MKCRSFRAHHSGASGLPAGRREGGRGWGTEGHRSSAQHLNSFFTMSNRERRQSSTYPVLLMVNMSALSACSHWLARGRANPPVSLTACPLGPAWTGLTAWSAGPREDRKPGSPELAQKPSLLVSLSVMRSLSSPSSHIPLSQLLPLTQLLTPPPLPNHIRSPPSHS